MSDIQFEIKIQGDSEGYVTFECPFCGSEFKLKADEFQSEDNSFTELYCPYCGLVNGTNTFYSKEVLEQARTLAENYMADKINEMFGKFERSVRNNKFIKVEYKKLKKVNTKELKDKDTVEEVMECPICKNHEKVLYCSGVSKVFCSYCGVDI
ncbi:hypothetical protein ONV75_16375 [Clostridium sp. LQ25]|uniref:hypothetical protein n=1 Tax=Clostridium sp. LQ25 TaxID=2992805 RepID=UPI0022559D31|nr:hypothetical protein [Clostridium sp. LQ25]UZT06157.1 hypothetical protein ONV75_16375 [Clostridium sp. LQ25]